MDEKKDRFRAVATRRTNNIIEQLRLLGNCANKHNYDYTDEEVNKIFKAVDEQLKETKLAFTKNKKKGRFEL